MATRVTKTKKIALISAVVVTGTSVAAFAYWTAGGSGTGSAATGTVVPLTAVQTSTIIGMAPGDSPQTLAGKFNNTNAGPVYVTSVTAAIASVVKAVDAPAGACTIADYTLASPLMLVNAEIPAGSSQGNWSGATIKFANNTAANQDGCKGATVNLAYTIS